MPNSLAISLGSLFAGWMMHLTGRYKAMNLMLGFLPFIGAAQVYLLREDSGFWVSWFSIVRPISHLYMFILHCFLGVFLCPYNVLYRSRLGSEMRWCYRRC